MTKKQEQLVLSYLQTPAGQEYLTKIIDESIRQHLNNIDEHISQYLKDNAEKFFPEDPADWWKKPRTETE